MATYPSAIEATNPLGSGDNRDNPAPVIAAGAPFGDNAELAKLEYETRKRMREANPTSVTQAEVSASRRRLCAIENVEAQVTHGTGMGALMAAVAANGAAIANIRRRERNRSNDWVPFLVERVGDNQIGVAPPNFPVSRLAVFRMTAVEIGILEEAFNLPVGHFGGLTLAERPEAVVEYFTES